MYFYTNNLNVCLKINKKNKIKYEAIDKNCLNSVEIMITLIMIKIQRLQ